MSLKAKISEAILLRFPWHSLVEVESSDWLSSVNIPLRVALYAIMGRGRSRTQGHELCSSVPFLHFESICRWGPVPVVNAL